jgi:hypothetical protein
MDGDAANELRIKNFATKQEYFMYKNACDACMRLLKGGQCGYYFTTQKVVRHFNDIVQKTISKNHYNRYAPDRVSLHLLVAIQLKDEPEFMQEFQDLSVVLYEKMREAGSDQVSQFLTEEEIMVVLNYMPSMISMIEHPSEKMQELVLKRRNAKHNLQFVNNPSESTIKEALRQGKLKISDITPEKRTPDMEVDALIRGELSLSSARVKDILNRWENIGWCIIAGWDLPKFVDIVETNSNCLTGQDLERFRLLFVSHHSQRDIEPNGDFAISHMHKPAPSKAVKERAVTNAPYAIGAIPFQYDAIQMLALQTAFAENSYIQDWDLDITYSLIKKPSVAVQKMYDDLRNLKSDMWYIANIKNQPAWMQLWLLDKINPLRFDADRLIARAESVIKNPTKEVLDKIAEMRAWQRNGTRGNGRSW